MKKTSVYLSDEEAEGLRLLARTTGRSQAELIREGVRRVLTRKPRRTFHSMGAGEGSPSTTRRWDAAELAQRRLGRHPQKRR
jgi:Arc/MetJ-type ribon-helix-helix transcriptional regulator